MKRKQTRKCIATSLLVAYIFSVVIFFTVITTPVSAIGVPERPTLPPAYQETHVFHNIQALLNKSTTIIETPKIIEKPLTQREAIEEYVDEICAAYDNKVKPKLVLSVIQTESEFNPKAKNGDSLGLMQISARWHLDRAKELGVKDFFDPYGNILLGVDYLVELTDKYKDPSLVLMMYNMGHDDALRLYSSGKVTAYARTILSRA